MVIGIFRTNIYTHQDKNNVIQSLYSRFNINSCSIDMEDCDRVMRVVAGTSSVNENDIILFMQSIGFQCDILD